MGYHKTEITPGVYGEASKIQEEFEEWQDSLKQENPIMELVELSDIILAIHGYTKRKFNIQMDDLVKMSKATKSAFEDGSRKTKNESDK